MYLAIGSFRSTQAAFGKGWSAAVISTSEVHIERIKSAHDSEIIGIRFVKEGQLMMSKLKN